MEAAAVLLPLIGAILAGSFSLAGRRDMDAVAMGLSVGAMVIAAILSIWIFVDVALGHDPRTIILFTWIDSGSLEADWALKVDTLTAVMLVVVNGVSCIVHIYSIGYMSHDKYRPRFFAYLSLFTFFMLMLVTADNFIQLFFGWEGVGLASYLLIGYYMERPSAGAASIKAFLVNRVGDFGLSLGIFTLFVMTGTVRFDPIFEMAPELVDQTFFFLGLEFHGLTLACVLLFVGAMGKSAQLGLHTWLPDAMEGPTPVSALIHAATMVTAGVFLVARCSPIFEYAPAALEFVAFIGATTAFIAATIGLTQFDIKRVIAYSTMSQLGYMFFALGISAYGAAIFHLMTHAFFKALLFLGAGSVIHALSDQQDMRKMGGIAKMIPQTYVLMWIGSLALAGIGIPGLFGTAGFYSKDIIIEAAFASHSPFGPYAFWMGIAAALLTAFYSWRLLFLTFHGTPRADEKVMAHVHESPRVMLWPLYVLAFGAIFAGFIAYEYFVGHDMHAFWGESLFVLVDPDPIEEAHHVPTLIKWFPLIVAAAGILLAYVMYIVIPGMSEKVANASGPLNKLFFNKWYFDEIYDAVFVKPASLFGVSLWKGGDQAIIDGLGPDGVSKAVVATAKRAGRLQTGYVYHYAFVMLIGVVCLVSWYLYRSLG